MYIGTFKRSCSLKWLFWYTKQQHLDLVCYQGSCQPRYNDTRTNLRGKFPHSLSLHTGLRSSTPSVNAPDITLNCCVHMYTSTCLRWLKARKWLIEMLHLRLVCCRFLSFGEIDKRKKKNQSGRAGRQTVLQCGNNGFKAWGGEIIFTAVGLCS